MKPSTWAAGKSFLDKAQRPGRISLFAAIVNPVATFSLEASVLTYLSVFRETPSSLYPVLKFLNRIVKEKMWSPSHLTRTRTER